MRNPAGRGWKGVAAEGRPPARWQNDACVLPIAPRLLRIFTLVSGVALIGWVDFRTGPDIGVSLFYLVPVFIAAWYDGSLAAVCVAVVAGITWFAADVMLDDYAVSISIWNGFTRLAIFVTIGVLVSRLRAERAELARTNDELEAFTYSVSHDLRSPLIHIGTFASMLENRISAGLDQTARRHLAAVQESAQLALGLIDDLLEFSRLGRTDLRTESVDLAGVVEDIRREMEESTRGRTVEWRIGALPVVPADRSMLRIVLHNLVENALKYSRPREVAIVEIDAHQNQNEFVVRVRDNGVGFDEKYGDKLFRVFERLHGAHEFEGTGIGLAIVQRIVTRHGGRAWARGKVGQGAEVCFTLPMAKVRTERA